MTGRPDRDALSELLAQERQRTQERVASLRRDYRSIVDGMELTSTDDEHDPEGATTAVERSRLEALLDAAERHLLELDAADKRLADGTYGRCVSCGTEIPLARLRIRPAASTCVDCAG